MNCSLAKTITKPLSKKFVSLDEAALSEREENNGLQKKPTKCLAEYDKCKKTHTHTGLTRVCSKIGLVVGRRCKLELMLKMVCGNLNQHKTERMEFLMDPRG